MKFKKILTPIVLLLVLIPFGVGSAANDFEVTLSVEYFCEDVAFEVDIDAGTGPFSLSINYGDTDEPIQMELEAFPLPLSHSYPGQGEYEIRVKVIDSEGLEGELEQEISLEGPEVTLESDPFPPLLTLEAGEAHITFTAIVDGGIDPFIFEWDLDGDDSPEDVDSTLNAAEFTYTEAGEYRASVRVTDGCGFSESDKLTVIVLDDELAEDEEDGDSGKACHPMAEKIASALSELSNEEHTYTYTCEYIYNFFRGDLTGSQLGFGRMWQAYRKAEVIKDLSWEVILDWKLNTSSWGALNQLNRVAETVGDVEIGYLVDLVVDGTNTVGELRTAMRMTLRYEAEFMDALERISDGTSQGEIGQFYKLAQELEMDPAQLDIYLGEGRSLSEVRHAAKLSDRIEVDLGEILKAHADGSGWGDINQAQRLADEGMTVESILAIGVNEYRKQLREEGRLEQLTERDERMTGREERIGIQFGEKYDASPEEVMALYNGECEWKWACVRAFLRNRTAENASSDGDERTLWKIVNQFGVDPALVSAELTECSGDWSCVRAHFREGAKEERGKK